MHIRLSFQQQSNLNFLFFHILFILSHHTKNHTHHNVNTKYLQGFKTLNRKFIVPITDAMS